MYSKKITVSVISDLTTDQRVIRICTTLKQMGFSVLVIARSFNDSLPLDTYIFDTIRIRCYFRKGIMQYAEFNFKLFFKILFCRTDYFLANDLDTLIPNFIVAKFRNKKLFYDTHEYFTGVPELKHSHLKRKVWKGFENWIFPKLKTVYTVNNSVRNKYFEEYGNEINIVRNVTVSENVVPFELPPQWKNKIVLMLQGAGINTGRGGIELLEAMKYLPENYLLVMIGGGTQWEEIKQMRMEWQLQNKVEMLEKMPPSKLKRYTGLAKIAFSLDSFDDLNCLYNLPNKIFDYIHAGVPVIATDIPEVKMIVEQYKCGICVENNEPKGLAQAVLNLMADRETYELYKKNCAIAAKDLCWEKEQHKLIQIYKPYL